MPFDSLDRPAALAVLRLERRRFAATTEEELAALDREEQKLPMSGRDLDDWMDANLDDLADWVIAQRGIAQERAIAGRRALQQEIEPDRAIAGRRALEHEVELDRAESPALGMDA